MWPMKHVHSLTLPSVHHHRRDVRHAATTRAPLPYMALRLRAPSDVEH